jgi:hypothetical protein
MNLFHQSGIQVDHSLRRRVCFIAIATKAFAPDIDAKAPRTTFN